jgi:hypothetical protein
MKIIGSSVAVIIVSTLGAVACSNGDPSKTEPVGSTTQADTVVKYHSEWSGGNAEASAYTQYSSFNLNVFENTSGTTRTAQLFVSGNGSDPTSQVCVTDNYCTAYDYSQPYPWPCTAWQPYTYCSYTRTYSEYGFGQIPSGDFQVGKHGAHLSTNLANDPGLYVTRCASDTVAGTYSCTSGIGTIDVTWADNGNFQSENDDTSTSKYSTPYSTYTTKTSGKSTSSSANVSGTVLGTPVNAQGTIGQSKGKSVSKDIIEEGGGGFMDGGLGKD